MSICESVANTVVSPSTPHCRFTKSPDPATLPCKSFPEPAWLSLSEPEELQAGPRIFHECSAAVTPRRHCLLSHLQIIRQLELYGGGSIAKGSISDTDILATFFFSFFLFSFREEIREKNIGFRCVVEYHSQYP